MNPLPARDADLVREVADTALHNARHGQSAISVLFAYEIADALGRAGVCCLIDQWATRAVQEMRRVGTPPAIRRPLVPGNNGGISTDTAGLAPPDLWAAWYLNAARFDDQDLTADLLACCTYSQLLLGAESVLMFTAHWTNLDDRTFG